MPKISQNCAYLTFLFVGVQKCYAPKFSSRNNKKLIENVFEIILGLGISLKELFSKHKK